MATREFRVEYLKDVVEGDEVARVNPYFDHNEANEYCDIVFYAKDDGKHYAFEFSFNNEVGANKFGRMENDDLVECHEVKEQQVTTTTWVKV